jgi:hypothetical protein
MNGRGLVGRCVSWVGRVGCAAPARGARAKRSQPVACSDFSPPRPRGAPRAAASRHGNNDGAGTIKKHSSNNSIAGINNNNKLPASQRWACPNHGSTRARAGSQTSDVTIDDNRIKCQNPCRDSSFDSPVDDNPSYIAELDDIEDDKSCTGTVGGIGIEKWLGAAGSVLFTDLFTFLLSRANESVSCAPLVLGIEYEVGDCTSVNPGSTREVRTAALGTITVRCQSLCAIHLPSQQPRC